ncbi:MAG TPA: hypothetical protein VGI30_03605 [Caulobacteraceae bacterium]
MVRVFLGLAALAWMLASPAAAASHLFTDDAPLHITLTAPFPALVRTAKYALNPYPATLTLTDQAGAAPKSFPIQVRARGISRRKVYCAFPPLMLTFDKQAMHGTLFHGQKKLKLVTYCKTPPDYEQRVMLEYLIYKLYNLITPVSLRVRAAEVTYRDSASDPGVTRFGYLIEDMNETADRNQRDELTAVSHQVSLGQLNAHAATRAAVLEFMIANLDWEFLASAPGEACCHNMRLLAAQGATPATASAVTPVPYDFDFSGFVDSPYAGPPPGIPIDRVTDRYFRGFCAMDAEIPSVAREYLARRADMKALIDNQPQLTAAFRDKTDHYLDGFFDVLNDPARLQSQLIRHCR